MDWYVASIILGINELSNPPAAAGYLGPDKTASRIWKVRYWVGMLYYINHYCKECSVRQNFKPPSLQVSYPTAIHASTGIAPFEMMFGHIPQQPPFPEPTAYDIFYLRSKLAQLTDFVKAHMTKAAHKQKLCYD